MLSLELILVAYLRKEKTRTKTLKGFLLEQEGISSLK